MDRTQKLLLFLEVFPRKIWWYFRTWLVLMVGRGTNSEWKEQALEASMKEWDDLERWSKGERPASRR